MTEFRKQKLLIQLWFSNHQHEQSTSEPNGDAAGVGRSEECEQKDNDETKHSEWTKTQYALTLFCFVSVSIVIGDD